MKFIETAYMPRQFAILPTIGIVKGSGARNRRVNEDAN